MSTSKHQPKIKVRNWDTKSRDRDRSQLKDRASLDLPRSILSLLASPVLTSTIEAYKWLVAGLIITYNSGYNTSRERHEGLSVPDRLDRPPVAIGLPGRHSSGWEHRWDEHADGTEKVQAGCYVTPIERPPPFGFVVCWYLWGWEPEYGPFRFESDCETGTDPGGQKEAYDLNAEISQYNRTWALNRSTAAHPYINT